MKHEITTLNTKRTLANSLKKLMKTKPFSKITISEVIRDCGLNRKTFYYHFEDIYALLKWIFEEEALEVVKQFNLLINYEEAINFVMDYVEENDYLISCVYDPVSQNQMRNFFSSNLSGIIKSVIEQAENDFNKTLDPEFKLYVARFYTEALSGMLIDWVIHRNVYDRKKIVTYLSAIVGLAVDKLKSEDAV